MIPSTLPIRFLLNPKADPTLPYGPERSRILNLEAHEEAYREISSWPGYRPTPLVHLHGLARELGVESIAYKDESTRFGLGSFKALGGIYGVLQVLRTHLAASGASGPLTSARISAGELRSLASRVTVTCASAGNHGRAVAQGAARFGCSAVVFLPAHTSPARVRTIEALGARAIMVPGSYDDAVVEAAARVESEGWLLVSDTAGPDYETVPRHIMQGYTVLARETLDQIPSAPLPTHVFLQAGVGGLAAAVTAHFWERLGRRRPRVVVVEPSAADCLLESALLGSESRSSGIPETRMECLACSRPSTLAWRILEEGADAFLTISDHAALETVRLLERGVAGDPPLATQASGAAGAAGLIAATFEPAFSGPILLGSGSRILIIGSEGPNLETTS